MQEPRARRPGNSLLDRYLKDADEETRERAREALRRFALALYRLAEHIVAEEKGMPDSPDFDRRPIL